MLKEDAPTNSAGSGNIDGIGVGPKGEPGVNTSSRVRHKRKSAADSNNRSTIIGDMLRRQHIQEVKHRIRTRLLNR